MTLNPAFRMLAARALTARATKRARKGFTLIELLVVVVIIGILAAIALPNFMGAQDKAKNASTVSNANAIRLGLEQYATDNGGFYPNTASFMVTTTGRQFFPGSGNNYLPNDTLPRSPWAAAAQTNLLWATGTGFTGSCFLNAVSAAAGQTMPPLQTRIATLGVAKQTASPTTYADFGAIEYDYDVNTQTYTLFATGKRNREAVLVYGSSNNGATAK